jgi:chemotaxis protein CheD
MSVTITPSITATKTVGLGQIMAAQNDQRLVTILGSCVAVLLYSPRKQLGVLAHIVLPHSSHAHDHPGRYANLAIPAMLAELEKLGQARTGLIAKLVGGSNMFASKGPMQVGEENILAAREILTKLEIELTAEDVGGTKGRRVTFDPNTGELSIEIVGGQLRFI